MKEKNLKLSEISGHAHLMRCASDIYIYIYSRTTNIKEGSDIPGGTKRTNTK